MTNDSKSKGCRQGVHVFMPRGPPSPTAALPAMTDKRKPILASGFGSREAAPSMSSAVPETRADDNPSPRRARER